MTRAIHPAPRNHAEEIDAARAAEDRRATCENLETLMAYLVKQIELLPDFAINAPWKDFTESCHQRQLALQAIAVHLRTHQDARISLGRGAGSATISMAGIRTSCTSGAPGVFYNWIEAAKRQIAALKSIDNPA